jgi:hypothetical protein
LALSFALSSLVNRVWPGFKQFAHPGETMMAEDAAKLKQEGLTLLSHWFEPDG